MSMQNYINHDPQQSLNQAVIKQIEPIRRNSRMYQSLDAKTTTFLPNT